MFPFVRRVPADFARRLFVLLVALLPSACAARRDTIRDWAQAVTLSPEYGSQGARLVRWVHPPRIAVYAPTSSELIEIQWVVGHLAETLRGTAGAPVLVGTDQPPSQVDIEVHPLPLAAFDGFARRHGFRYTPGNHGYFWMFWDESFRLQRAYVMLARDEIRPGSLRHYALEELTQCLGFAGDTPHFADSIFFSRGGSTGHAQALSALDRQLLRFVYTHIEPGTDRPTFISLFDRHWPR